jgi:fucose permease
MLWPSMRISIHEPVGALGIVLVAGVATAAVSSAVTGRILARVPAGPLLACGTALVAGALATEALAPAFWLIVTGSAVFSAGFGAIDGALNAYAARHFGARQINWMHAGYGLGATLGPLLVTAMLGGGLGRRFALGSMAAVLTGIALALTAARRRWEVPPADTMGSFRRISPESTHGSEQGAGRRRRVLAAAVTGIPVGAVLMTVPAPGFVAVTGMLLLGLAAAPVFPLLTLTTADRVGAGDATTVVGLQVAASAVGSAALPSGIGLAIGAVSARALGPALLVLGLAMCAVYWLALRSR